MADISAEPSMEEILSSIKRIIAEEGDQSPARRRPAPRHAAPPPLPVTDHDDEPDEVLELRDPVSARPVPPPAPATAPEPVAPPPPAARARPEIVSDRVADATRGSIEALTRLVVKPETGSDGTLEGLVREMLRPMLRDWLDANLPDLVETMVAREIAKITGQPR